MSLPDFPLSVRFPTWKKNAKKSVTLTHNISNIREKFCGWKIHWENCASPTWSQWTSFDRTFQYLSNKQLEKQKNSATFVLQFSENLSRFPRCLPYVRQKTLTPTNVCCLPSSQFPRNIDLEIRTRVDVGSKQHKKSKQDVCSHDTVFSDHAPWNNGDPLSKSQRFSWCLQKTYLSAFVFGFFQLLKWVKVTHCCWFQIRHHLFKKYILHNFLNQKKIAGKFFREYFSNEICGSMFVSNVTFCDFNRRLRFRGKTRNTWTHTHFPRAYRLRSPPEPKFSACRRFSSVCLSVAVTLPDEQTSNNRPVHDHRVSPGQMKAKSAVKSQEWPGGGGRDPSSSDPEASG